ncbi:hypothetical protein K9M59_03975 [Candidatus Gracilibacteria bacterium]|nr:hypothetical protein [Candidatus Gracilibacteria bacterium]MCF7819481.1 hypothetical protein [Candidatus Gracilibacteria bacterium]
MKRKCAVSGQEFEITEKDLEFYKKMNVPEPTLCPEERQRRRLSWRNERNLYRRKCDATGKTILSIYSPEKPFKIYHQDVWHSDSWDGRDWGKEYDFDRPFFDQFSELMRDVPRMALVTAGNENAEFVNYAGWNQNCYLIFDSDHNQDCYYLVHAFYNKNCADSFYINRCELCYECITSYDCYDCRFLQDCKNCVESWFLKSCIGCKNCFGCVNLRNKEYYFLNKKCTKEEYSQKLETLQLHRWSKLKDMRQKFAAFIQRFPHKYYQGTQNEDVTGDYIDGSKDVHFCYNVENSRDCMYLADCQKCKDCWDLDEWGGTGAELCYEGHVVGEGAQNIAFCSNIWEGVHDIFYSEFCVKGSHDLFGCEGLKHASYCILNKQYSKEEYFTLRDQIINHMKQTGEWGEFFPIKLSSVAYNESMAMEYFPLSREEVLSQGWAWKEKDTRGFQEQEYKIPDSLNDVEDNILEQVLACEKTGKNYKIEKQELKLYRKLGIPIPRRCFDTRHQDRMDLRNPKQLWARDCDECGIHLQSTFAPDRPETILCEKCYNEVVDGGKKQKAPPNPAKAESSPLLEGGQGGVS